MNLAHLPAQIAKTGFVLENRIAQALKAEKWTVISNRYYVDDAEESVREIDLVAYQTTKVQHFDVYTTLIISCKKSESNLWALLARDINLKDPNSDWQPLHAWSNDKAINFQLAGPSAAKRYHDGAQHLGVHIALQTPTVEVFAFQEMNKTSGAPQNDKNIFAAVTSLMKAQAYEIGALPQRKKSPAIYQFNLLSIVDAELVRLIFSEQTIDAVPVDGEHYIARYIIKKQESVSRIRFVRAEMFEKFLPEYSALHNANCQWFDQECNDFYRDVMKDGKRVALLIEVFRKEAGWHIRWPFIENSMPAPDVDSVNMFWSDRSTSVKIYGAFGEDGVRVLNADANAKGHVAKALLNVYRYNGLFEFEDDDIPF
jgi:hypothetical protein